MTSVADIVRLEEHTTHITAADDAYHFCFDVAGRLITARFGERFFRIGLDSTVLAQRRTRIEPLDDDDAWSVFDDVAGHAARVADGLGLDRVRLDGRCASVDEAKRTIGSVESFDDDLATLDRTLKHLEANGVDQKKYPISMGPLLKFDPDKEVFPDSPEATAMVAREYREGFVCPTADQV